MTDDNQTTSSSYSDEIAALRETSVETMLGNHIFVLLQFAAVQLADTPPKLESAQVVIDVIAAIIQTAGTRLGDNVDLYRNALAEVQQVYVRAASASNS